MEEIGELIGKGFGIWKRNLNLCIPFLFSVFLSIMVTLPFLAAFFITAMPMADANETLLQNNESMQELIAQMQGTLDTMDMDKALQITLIFLVLAATLSLVNAFFTAGAIGMARQALETGKSDTGAMWSAGKSHFINMFLATLLMGFLIVAGLIFLLPALVQGIDPLQADSQTIGLVAAGLVLFILYALILSVVLVIMPYALVVQNLGPVQAVRESANFFRYNKFDVVVLWMVVAALSLGLQMITGAFSPADEAGGAPLSALNGLINLLILAPLSNLWWTRLYMSRKGILRVDEVKDPW